MMVHTMKRILSVVLVFTPIYILATAFKDDPLRRKIDGTNIFSEEELEHALQSLSSSTAGHLDLTLLEIENLRLSRLPLGLFKNSIIRQLILRNITLKGLTSPYESDTLFNGLQGSLVSIAFIGLQITEEANDKSHEKLLSGFKKLKTIIMTRSSTDLFKFTGKFRGMKDVPLTRIMSTSSLTTKVPGNSLSYFGKTLEELVLEGCEIRTAERNWFATTTMEVLRRINLSFNQLAYVRKTFFTGMPKLKEVDLEHNPALQILIQSHAETFQHLDLTYLGVYDTNIDCNQPVDWLIKDNGVNPPFYERPDRVLLCPDGSAVKDRMKHSSQ